MTEIDRNLNWKPSLFFKVNDHLLLAAEVSDIPYPRIISLRRPNIIDTPVPISVYSVCPEEAYLADQASAKELMAHGYGLLTVAADGGVQIRASCIPLVQIITLREFNAEVFKLPAALRRRLAESFEKYKQSAPSGVADITEVMEGLVLGAGREAAKKTLIANADAKAGSPATTLAAMIAKPHFKNAMAGIGAAQSYINVYRNSSHHFPKNRKQAYQKYRECRHAFIEGIKKIHLFRNAMVNAGLSGKIAS